MHAELLGIRMISEVADSEAVCGQVGEDADAQRERAGGQAGRQVRDDTGQAHE
ncbi:hypothetical protein [Planomonospora parontospora]|uniref:hypothetical protein n=1 Tax=Planomonospora parontospora TaxID=58119 RepID=UPI00177ACBBC|nr:hypothetical protein [Planomonospora parontospora]